MEKPEVSMYEKDLHKVFTTGNDVVATRAVRLAVLFEDLRVEYLGAKLMEPLEPLDDNGADYRRLYFIRRSLVTMIEFSGAISRMNEIKEWRQHLKTKPKMYRDPWNNAVKFFNEHHKTFEKMRGDLGGHFPESSSEFSLKHIYPGATGSITIRRFAERQTAGILFGFTHEIVSIALRKTMDKATPTLEELQAFIHKILSLIMEAWNHAVSAVTVIASQYFVPQFALD